VYFSEKTEVKIAFHMNNSKHFKAEFSTDRANSTRVPRGLAIFVVTFVGINILVATISNASLLILLRRRRDLRKVPHYLLGNLALTGLLAALFNMPLLIGMTAVNYFEMNTEVPAAVEVFCKVSFSSSFAFLVLTDLTLFLMAFDRQDCVLRPLNRRITQSKVKKIIPLTWILSLLTAAFFAIAIRNESAACIKFYPYNNVARLPSVLLAAIAVVAQLDTLTVLFIPVTSFRTIKQLRSAEVSPLNSAHRRQEMKLIRDTCKICTVFLLFRVPINVCHFVANIGGYRGPTTNSAMLVTVTLAASLYVAIPFLHHEMLQVKPPNQQQTNQQSTDQPRVSAWRTAARPETVGFELTRSVRINPQ